MGCFRTLWWRASCSPFWCLTECQYLMNISLRFLFFFFVARRRKNLWDLFAQLWASSQESTESMREIWEFILWGIWQWNAVVIVERSALVHTHKETKPHLGVWIMPFFFFFNCSRVWVWSLLFVFNFRSGNTSNDFAKKDCHSCRIHGCLMSCFHTVLTSWWWWYSF